jgi:hypothetical protein
MKKIFCLILIILFNLNIQAQKYEFDLLTKYTSKMVNYEHESLAYSNTKDQNYILYINGNSLTKNATLYDLGKMTLHNFSVSESKIENEIFFEFEYKKTLPINQKTNYNNYKLEAKTINNDSLNKEIKIDIFKKSNVKKPEITLVLKVKKINNNLFPLFRFSCLHPFEFNQNLNLSENLKVESAKEINLSGQLIEHRLVSEKEVKFEIEIPVNKKHNE